MRVIVGGTFGHLHAGHMALLRKAFEVGDYVYIGLTTDNYVKRLKDPQMPPYNERKELVHKFAETLGKKFDIMPLDDSFGPSTTEDFDAIVVTQETFPAAVKINKIRRKNGLGELRIIMVDFVLAFDSAPISTTRIMRGEIDREGRQMA